MTTLKVGIASYEEMKARTMPWRAASGASRPVSRRCGSLRRSRSPRCCRPAIASCCASSPRRRRLARRAGRITGKAKSNLSRTLRTMEGYGLVRLERGERGRITPKVTHDRVELDLPLTLSRKAG